MPAAAVTVADVTRDLRDRIAAALPGLPVHLGPGAAPAEGLLLSLGALRPEAPPGEARRPLVLLLDYRLEAMFDDPLAAHAALGEAAFALLADPDTDVSAAEGALALSLRRRLLRARPAPAMRRVLHPLRVATDALGMVEGQVVGPGDHPIAGAAVALPALDRSAVTDAAGRFRLHGVPAEAGSGPLVVTAHDVRMMLPSVPPGTLVLRLPLEE